MHYETKIILRKCIGIFRYRNSGGVVAGFFDRNRNRNLSEAKLMASIIIFLNFMILFYTSIYDWHSVIKKRMTDLNKFIYYSKTT